MSIYYENVKVWTTHIKTSEYNPKTGKHKQLKKPIVTEKVHVINETAFDLGELYELISYAKRRDVYSAVDVSFTVKEGH